MNLPVRVVKIGGSLFNFPQLSESWHAWLNAQAPAHHVLIAGGGAFADVVRDVDRIQRIGDEFGHWLCVQLLDSSATLLSGILCCERLEWEGLLETLGASRQGRCAVVAPARFLYRHEPHLPGHQLARNWRTTTDSIAARIATGLGATELVLVKSCPLPAGMTWNEAARQGYVDEEFAAAAAGQTVRWVNLRRLLSRYEH